MKAPPPKARMVSVESLLHLSETNPELFCWAHSEPFEWPCGFHETRQAQDRIHLNLRLDPRPLRPHDSDPDPMPSPHEESCGCHWCTPEGREVFRTVNGIPFERIKIDPAALTFAADDYEAATGHVDEIALGYAILSYLEAQAAA